MNNVKNVKFALTKSIDKDYEEVLATFSLDGETTKYYIFIKKNKTYRQKDYLKEAKKRFYADLKSNKVKKVLAIGHKKKWVVLAASICGVAAISCAGYFTYKHLANPSSKWKVATEEEVIKMRDDILKAQEGKDPFNYLSKVLNGKQILVNDNFTSEYDLPETLQPNESGNIKFFYQIDYDKAYIKEHKNNEETGEISDSYYTYHDDHVYECYDKDGQKYTDEMYQANNIDEARNKFVFKKDPQTEKEVNISYTTANIYGYRYFGVFNSGGEKEDYLKYYIEMLDDIKELGGTPVKKFYTANNLSFKVSCSAEAYGEIEEGIEGDLEITLDVVAENGILTSFKNTYVEEAVIEGEPSRMSLVYEYSIDKTSFELDNLDEYFE